MTDEQLQRLLQSALPPVHEAAVPRDAWAAIAVRLESRPSWSRLDTALALAVITALALIPDALLLLALHL